MSDYYKPKSILTPKDAIDQGYREYFGPCDLSEEWMLRNAISDITKAGKDDYVLLFYSPGHQMIYVRPKPIYEQVA